MLCNSYDCWINQKIHKINGIFVKKIEKCLPKTPSSPLETKFYLTETEKTYVNLDFANFSHFTMVVKMDNHQTCVRVMILMIRTWQTHSFYWNECSRWRRTLIWFKRKDSKKRRKYGSSYTLRNWKIWTKKVHRNESLEDTRSRTLKWNEGKRSVLCWSHFQLK